MLWRMFMKSWKPSDTSAKLCERETSKAPQGSNSETWWQSELEEATYPSNLFTKRYDRSLRAKRLLTAELYVSSPMWIPSISVGVSKVDWYLVRTRRWRNSLRHQLKDVYNCWDDAQCQELSQLAAWAVQSNWRNRWEEGGSSSHECLLY